MNDLEARYALVRDRLRRQGRDLALIVTPIAAEDMEIEDAETGERAVFHGNRYDSLSQAIATVEGLASTYTLDDALSRFVRAAKA